MWKTVAGGKRHSKIKKKLRETVIVDVLII